MKKTTLYTGGGVSLSPLYEEGRTESNYVRLVADDGMALKKGGQIVFSVDVPKSDIDEWDEIEYSDDYDEIPDEEAFSIITGESA